MIRTIQQIRGRTLAATDGPIGEVTDLFFDDAFWHVRYFVVETGNELSQRTVLIAPEAVHPADWTDRSFPVDLTIAQVRGSPRVESDQPAARRQKQVSRAYTDWPADTGFSAGEPLAPLPLLPPVASVPRRALPPANQHLRSAEMTLGYHLESTDGPIGRVEEFLVDERSWEIRYLVVDTRNWLPGRKVVVAPAWIESTDWARRRLVVNLTRNAIKRSPPYDPDLQWNPAYSAELHGHYRQPPYPDWDLATTAPGSARDGDRPRHSDGISHRAI